MKKDGTWRLQDRMDTISTHYKPPKSICPDCNRNGQDMDTCPECNAKTISIGFKLRVPRKTASRRKWNAFWILLKEEAKTADHKSNYRY